MLATPVRQAFQPFASDRESRTCTILRATYGRATYGLATGVRHLFAGYEGRR